MDATAADATPPGGGVSTTAAARPRGRRKWIIAGVVGVVLGAVFVFSGARRTGTRATLTFVGFTNSEKRGSGGRTGLHAFFWVTNGSRPSLWSIGSVSRRITNEWVDFGSVDHLLHQEVPRSEKWVFYRPPHQARLISLPVEGTKLPLRVVMYVDEEETGLEEVTGALHDWFSRYVQRNVCVWTTAADYSVTNEFHPPP